MIKKVSYADIFYDPDFTQLVKEYGEECSQLGTPNPQPELYALLESSGGLQVFGVYDSQRLVGFAAVLIYVLPHFGKKIASSESIFISPRHRKCWKSLDLIDEMKNHAKLNGCEKFIYSAPVGSQFDQMLSILYPHTNNVYMEDLK